MARIPKITNANVGPLKNKVGLVGNTPVRAQDFNALVGDYVSNSSVNTGRYMIHCQFVDNSAAFVQNSDSIVSWTQPANTFIKNITLLVTGAPETAASADLGYEVGSTSSGEEIVALDADNIIDAGADGTDVVAGALIELTMLRKTADATTLAADASYTESARTLYFNTVCSDHAVTTSASVRWLLEYIQFA